MDSAPIYTIQNFASAIREAENRHDEAAIFNQVKGLQGRGLLHHSGLYGPRGALLYSASEAIRVRLLIAALDAGIRSGDLGKLNSYIEEKLPAFANSLDRYWLVEIARVRDADTDELGISVSWHIDGRHLGAAADPLSDIPGTEVVSAAGTPVESVLIIRASDLVRPLIAKLRT